MRKVLRSNDYFGEISLIYGCNRTATVTSSKYSTLAMLSKEAYKELLIEFPEMEKDLKEGVFKYNDRVKNFITKSIQRVPYFRNVDVDALHDIIYMMKDRVFSKGSIIQSPGDDASSLFFIQDGLIEIYTQTESGEDFVLEKLFPGSVINYRTFFLESNAMVYIRMGRTSIMKELPYHLLNELLPKHPELKKQFSLYRNKTLLRLQANSSIPLDYIMVMPYHLK